LVDDAEPRVQCATDLAAVDVIDRYKALADIERGFRVLKQDIDIAPVHHRLPERIRAHALICFLALVLHRILRSRMRTTGSPLSPTRALALLRQVQHIDLSINQQPAARTSTITPEQRDLFALMKLPAPTKNARL
jgi:transposase